MDRSNLIATDAVPIKYDPPWCTYWGAYTHGGMGCWSISSGRVTSKLFCLACECFEEETTK